MIAVDNETLDSSKYRVSGYYNLTVRDIGLDDDAWYECRLVSVADYTAKLTVSGQYTLP